MRHHTQTTPASYAASRLRTSRCEFALAFCAACMSGERLAASLSSVVGSCRQSSLFVGPRPVKHTANQQAHASTQFFALSYAPKLLLILIYICVWHSWMGSITSNIWSVRRHSLVGRKTSDQLRIIRDQTGQHGMHARYHMAISISITVRS